MSTQSIGLFLAANDSIHGLAGTAASITYTIFGKGPLQSKILAQGQLGTADALLYSPATEGGEQALVSAIVLANVTSGAISGVKLGINGSAATAANQILSSSSIPANGQAIFDGRSWTAYDSGGNLQLAGAGNTAFDATIAAVTTPLALGTAGSAATAAHRDHTHQSPGGIASITAPVGPVTNTETQAVGASVPANLLQAGSVVRFKASGTITSTVDNVITFRVRLGPTTLTGNIPASLAVHCGFTPGTATTAPFTLEVQATVRTAGAGGTVYAAGGAFCNLSGDAGQAFPLASELFTPASVALNTTVLNIAELTVVTAAGTSAVTFQTATVEIVKM